MKKDRKLGGIILAAGQGKRMQVDGVNKVTLHLDNKPIIAHIVHFMQRMFITETVVVIGHAKESVMQTLENDHVIFAEQRERLGTGHALQVGVDAVPEGVTDVFVVYGDDAVFYNDK